MSKSGPKSLSDLVTKRGGAIERLAAAAAGRLALGEHLRSSIEPALAAHLRGANLREDGSLVVLADSPEWATRLRFESSRLLAACRRQYPGATRVLVRVGGAA
ncbi:MAG: DUF721 domain-containing protein [Gammaproteobacteria bacterium]|nr:MAG: DUF721 domain-containing protein [Gammaproteobacteria bacterium]